MTPTATTYRLVPHAAASAPPTLDADQQAVVDHPGGPLLVLAGPGTGKTTTLVEANVDRIETRVARPEEVLAMTFSRKAAEQLRDRVAARVGRTTSATLGSTFHSFAYGLIRPDAGTIGRDLRRDRRPRPLRRRVCGDPPRRRDSGVAGPGRAGAGGGRSVAMRARHRTRPPRRAS